MADKLLGGLYTDVRSLRTYAEEVRAVVPPALLPQPGRPPAVSEPLQRLLESVVVARRRAASFASLPPLRDAGGAAHAVDVLPLLLRVIQRNLSSGLRCVLSKGHRLGYDYLRVASDAHTSVVADPGATHKDLFARREWKELAGYVGRERFLALLTDPSLALFRLLANGCLHQLTGVPFDDDLRELQRARHVARSAREPAASGAGAGAGAGAGVPAGAPTGGAAGGGGRTQSAGAAAAAAAAAVGPPRAASVPAAVAVAASAATSSDPLHLQGWWLLPRADLRLSGPARGGRLQYVQPLFYQAFSRGGSRDLLLPADHALNACVHAGGGGDAAHGGYDAAVGPAGGAHSQAAAAAAAAAGTSQAPLQYSRSPGTSLQRVSKRSRSGASSASAAADAVAGTSAAAPAVSGNAARRLVHHIFVAAPHVTDIRIFNGAPVPLAVSAPARAPSGGGGGGGDAAAAGAAAAAGDAPPLARQSSVTSAAPSLVARQASIATRAASSGTAVAALVARQPSRAASAGTATASAGSQQQPASAVPVAATELPRPLLCAVPYFLEMTRRHHSGAVPYRRLLARHCPMRDVPPAATTTSSSAATAATAGGGDAAAPPDAVGSKRKRAAAAVADDFSATAPPQKQRQASGGRSRPAPPPPAPPGPGASPMDLFTPHEHVMDYVRGVLNALLPAALWGCPDARRHIMRLVWRWVTMGRKDKVAVEELLHGMPTQGWAPVFGGADARGAPRHVDSRLVARHVHTWVTWLLTSLVSPLLASAFYITDSEVFHQRPLYYRKPTWARLTRLALGKLRAQLRLVPLGGPAAGTVVAAHSSATGSSGSIPINSSSLCSGGGGGGGAAVPRVFAAFSATPSVAALAAAGAPVRAAASFHSSSSTRPVSTGWASSAGAPLGSPHVAATSNSIPIGGGGATASTFGSLPPSTRSAGSGGGGLAPPLWPASAPGTRPPPLPLGVAPVRLIPKSTGLRAITNLSADQARMRASLAAKAATAGAQLRGKRKPGARSASHAGADPSPAASALAALTALGVAPASLLAPAVTGTSSASLASASSSSAAAGAAAPPPAAYGALRPINKQLDNVHEVLKLQRRGQPACVGSAVFGLDGMYGSLRRFAEARRLRLVQQHQLAGGTVHDAPSSSSPGAAQPPPPPRPRPPPPPPLFIISCDVTGAYDSIRQAKLAEVVAGLLPPADAEFEVRAYVSVAPAAADPGEDWAGDEGDTSLRSRVRYRKVAVPLADRRPFHAQVEQLAADTRDTVFIDSGSLTRVTSGEVASLLRRHVEAHLVRLPGGLTAAQGAGLPQGSILSSLLCNVYFGHMETTTLLPAVLREAAGNGSAAAVAASVSPPPAPLSLLMRLTDDFVLVTECPRQAAAFARVTHGGLPDYNCAVAPAKTESSFPVTVPASAAAAAGVAGAGAGAAPRGELAIPAVPDGAPVGWCGLLLHPATGAVTADYSRYCGPGKLAESLIVTFAPSVDEAVARMLRAFLRPKCHPVLLDGVINSVEAVALNVYQLCLLAASKLVVLLSRAPGATVGRRFIAGHLGRGADYLVALVRKRCPVRAPPLPPRRRAGRRPAAGGRGRWGQHSHDTVAASCSAAGVTRPATVARHRRLQHKQRCWWWRRWRRRWRGWRGHRAGGAYCLSYRAAGAVQRRQPATRAGGRRQQRRRGAVGCRRRRRLRRQQPAAVVVPAARRGDPVAVCHCRRARLHTRAQPLPRPGERPPGCAGGAGGTRGGNIGGDGGGGGCPGAAVAGRCCRCYRGVGTPASATVGRGGLPPQRAAGAGRARVRPPRRGPGQVALL
jgi:hypothetical protein